MTLTAEALRGLLKYDPVTGHFTNLITRNRCAVAGARAGWLAANGYWSIRIARRSYLAHRLAWLHTHGDWPIHQIDHINGDRSDNRIANLRDVTASLNQQNVSNAQRNNRLGLLGVSRNGSGFSAAIEAHGKRRHLGTFRSAEAASAAYFSAKSALHVPCGRPVAEVR